MPVIKQYPSPNFSDRKPGGDPSILVFHYTDMIDAKSALDRLCDPAAEVSAHYLIDEDGTVYQLVDEGKRAWHAGISYWRGLRDINSHSIGIELANPGQTYGLKPYPEAQIKSLIALSKEIIARYSIAPENIVGHSDIAPDRKSDPGPYFPWKTLAEQGISKWPDFGSLQGDDLIPKLHEMGYNPELSNDVVLKAFDLRYGNKV